MSVRTSDALELTGNFLGKQHSFHRSWRGHWVLSHYAFEVFAERMPQLGPSLAMLRPVRTVRESAFSKVTRRRLSAGVRSAIRQSASDALHIPTGPCRLRRRTFPSLSRRSASE